MAPRRATHISSGFTHVGKQKYLLPPAVAPWREGSSTQAISYLHARLWKGMLACIYACKGKLAICACAKECVSANRRLKQIECARRRARVREPIGLRMRARVRMCTIRHARIRAHNFVLLLYDAYHLLQKIPVLTMAGTEPAPGGHASFYERFTAGQSGRLHRWKAAAALAQPQE